LQANQSTYEIVFHTQSKRTTHFAVFVCATITTGPVCILNVGFKQIVVLSQICSSAAWIESFGRLCHSLFISGHNRSSLSYQFNVSFHSLVVTQVL